MVEETDDEYSNPSGVPSLLETDDRQKRLAFSKGSTPLSQASKKKVAIIGASGYSGAEIAALLLKHLFVELNTLMTANAERQTGPPRHFSQELPFFLGRCDLDIEPLNIEALVKREIAVVFVATPNETSHELVPELLAHSLRVIDLSGSFRLKGDRLYPTWYGFEHRFPELLQSAVYGLTEVHREAIRTAQLVANPGCYPTSALLPLIPLQRAGMIDLSQDIICDSKSGVTGAGKTPTANTHFSEVSDSFKAYNVMKHRHAPEIWQELTHNHLIFTPHLLPINRGILSTIYLRLGKKVSEHDVSQCYQANYHGQPFIRIFPKGVYPEIKFVTHTNYCDIGWNYDAGRSNLILISAIDNLVKGAAGQAVQNMNVMLGFDEKTGLI
jgi:N-acetyl-gamma-glutamyl-phosphate reductase